MAVLRLKIDHVHMGLGVHSDNSQLFAFCFSLPHLSPDLMSSGCTRGERRQGMTETFFRLSHQTPQSGGPSRGARRPPRPLRHQSPRDETFTSTQNNTEIPGRGKGAQYLRKQLLSLSFTPHSSCSHDYASPGHRKITSKKPERRRLPAEPDVPHARASARADVPDLSASARRQGIRPPGSGPGALRVYVLAH